MIHYSDKIQKQLEDSLKILKSILGLDLLGAYLFGSAVVGGLQKYSDIDLLVVANRTTTLEEKTKLVAHFLQISGIYMKSSKSPIEITLVKNTDINPWKYPPQFDFQYGEWLRTSFERGIVEPWDTHSMPDLALIVTQVLLKSETLWGLEPKRLLADVPCRDCIEAMLHDLDRLSMDLNNDTQNVLLTLARIWSVLDTSLIRSKSRAADWVIEHLPKLYQPVIKRAKSIYIGAEDEHWEDIKSLIKPCADFIIDEIHKQYSLLDLGDPIKKIKLAGTCP